MATIKNIPDSYTINVPLMTVNGNLNITGNTTTINSATINVDDVLMFNTNSSVNYNASIGVYRPTAANVFLRWNEATTTWQVTNDGTNYGNILTTPAGNLSLSANLYLQNTTVSATPITGFAGLYGKAPGLGGAGLYVANSAYSNEELIIKRRSIAYSILFG
jgi:hypothetical protein